MPILNQIDLIMHIQKLQLQKDTLFVSPMFTQTEKNQLASLCDQMIAVYEIALQNYVATIEVREPQYS